MLIKAICINASLLNQLLDLCNSCNACMHKTYRNYVLNLEHKETFILITVYEKGHSNDLSLSKTILPERYKLYILLWWRPIIWQAGMMSSYLQKMLFLFNSEIICSSNTATNGGRYP